jgi:hypothetical protein
MTMESLKMVLIPFIVLMAPVLITALVLRYRRVRTEMRYQLLLKLTESGLALPAHLPGEATPQQCDRRRALVLIGSGLGLSLTLLALPLHYHLARPVSELWGFGVFPFVLGLGYLVNWFLTRRGSARE